MTTKEQAIADVTRRLQEHRYNNLKPTLVIDVLEALGLVKFDPSAPPVDPVIEAMIDAEQRFNDQQAELRGNFPRPTGMQKRVDETREKIRPKMREKMRTILRAALETSSNAHYDKLHALYQAVQEPKVHDSSAWTGRK